jgi:DnaA-homolog protein
MPKIKSSLNLARQLSFDLSLNVDANFANFCVGANQELYTLLQSLNQKSTQQFIYLWGGDAVGKSHLLLATCRKLSAEGLSVLYLPLSTIENLSAETFDNLESLFLLTLDDIEAVLSKPLLVEAVFHLFNRFWQHGKNLIVTSHLPPAQLRGVLPDLQSRFTSMIVWQVKGLNDEEKLEALLLHAQQRSLILSAKTAEFLLQHCQRDLNELFQVLRQLEKAALQAQRQLTVPFVKKVLGIN